MAALYFPHPRVRPVDITFDPRSPTRDSFGRIRTSSPNTLFDSKQVGGEDVLRWDNATMSGAGAASAHNTNRSSTTLSVSANTAGRRVRQSLQHFVYQPGKSQSAETTAIFSAIVSGITHRMGYFTDSDGLFVQQTVTGRACGVRSSVSGSPVDRLFAQNAWNFDRLDGTGPSGFNLDFTKATLAHIDFEWYSVGGVRYGFVIDNQLVYCHFERHANIATAPYMKTPNLPIRYELTNDGTGPAATLEAVCASVVSEGGREYLGVDRAFDRGVTPLVVPGAGAYYPLLATRLDPTKPGQAARPSTANVVCESASIYNWRILVNPTVVGTALNWLTAANTDIQYAAPANTTTVTGGTLVGSGYGRTTATSASTDTKFESPDLFLGVGALGTESTVVVLAVAVNAGTNTNFYGGISYHLHA